MSNIYSADYMMDLILTLELCYFYICPFVCIISLNFLSKLYNIAALEF